MTPRNFHAVFFKTLSKSYLLFLFSFLSSSLFAGFYLQQDESKPKAIKICFCYGFIHLVYTHNFPEY